MRLVIEGRHAREYAPTLEAVRALAATARGDTETPDDVTARITETCAVMEMFDEFYQQIARLPRPAQLAILRSGAKLASLIPSQS